MATTRGCRTATGLVLLALATGFATVAAQGTAAAPGTLGYKAPVIDDTSALKGPRQPIFFRHDIHAGQDRIPCMYCHSTVAVSSEPGIPALRTCIGCHQIIGGSTPAHQAEIQRVRKAWSDRKPPEWIRIHSVPGFVHFPHMRHIKALGTGPESCAACHGEVNRMAQVSQVSTLKMGWCIQCHEQRQVSRDCTICHF
ncbi:MAG TPA: cytochrome c3 family protein [Gemmatimonadales bacterium]|nr:cytochrome c3 family protein [Gemmatimonadales bacterium]